jgi:signal transduction histidine kinase
VVFLSLCFDLLALVYLATLTGGLRSPIMQGQLVYTVLFALIYPTPLAILPPLLILPVVTKIEQLLGTQMAVRDLLLLLWYFVVNVILVYVVVYLDRREEESFRELDQLQRRRRQGALTEERSRIAREMHDGLGAILSSLVIQTEYLLSQTEPADGEPAPGPPGAPPALVKELRELHRTGQEGIEELRRAVSMMRDDYDLTSALEDMCAAVTTRAAMPVSFTGTGRERPLAADQQLTVYRVLQECLANAVRHAQARAIDVTLAYEDDAAVLTVRDDGVGFDPAASRKGHYGLTGMRERAVRAGGEIAIEARPGAGSRITLVLPYRY